MSNEPSQLQQLKPYIIVAAILFVILLVVMFWPSSDSTEPMAGDNRPVVTAPAKNITDTSDTDVFQPIPQPSGVELSSDMAIEEFEAEDVSIDMPLDVSDESVKIALLEVAKSPLMAKYLINDGLIQKFVVNVNNLAQQSLSPKDSLVVPPAETFKTYTQADRIFIDDASFQRYTPYVEAVESLDADELLEVYDNYKGVIEAKFAEISRPGENFDDTLMNAIDELLDTPETTGPIEIYSESVMYKFKDAKLENLSAPQKQMLRAGPENMRKIKDVLRKLKTELEDRQ